MLKGSETQLTGQTLSHYQIQEKLGQGGMGVVYRALDTHLNRPVALKLLPADKVSNPERRKRFVQEARAASALNHPHIVTIYDIASHDQHDFIAMELIEGKTLDQLLHRKALPLTDTFKYSIQIADALSKAHAAGIVHRDLKPSNIMVTDDGRVKVVDFGLAKLLEPEQAGAEANTLPLQDAAPKTDEGTIVGTPSYMSPEQVEGKKLDARSDVFSFGSAPIRFSVFDLETRQNWELISHSTLDIHGAELSPDSKWVAFHIPRRVSELLKIAPVRDGKATGEAEWITVTGAAGNNRRPWWSPDGNLLYFLSTRDGYSCIWAQRLDPSTKRPRGEPMAVCHFHETRRSPSPVTASFGPAVGERADCVRTRRANWKHLVGRAGIVQAVTGTSEIKSTTSHPEGCQKVAWVER
jgi:serine/threonine protein kinase